MSLIGAFAILAVGASGCDSSGIKPSSSSDIAVETPLPTPSPEPLSAEDAIRVNNIVDALKSNDLAKIRPFVGFRKIACATDAADTEHPKCQGSEHDGDLVDAFYFATCQGGYYRDAQLDALLPFLTQTDVYGAYRRPKISDKPYEYSVILVDHGPQTEGFAWDAVIDNGQLIGLIYSCSLSPEDLVQKRRYTVAVPTPSSPPAPTTIG